MLIILGGWNRRASGPIEMTGASRRPRAAGARSRTLPLRLIEHTMTARLDAERLHSLQLSVNALPTAYGLLPTAFFVPATPRSGLIHTLSALVGPASPSVAFSVPPRVSAAPRNPTRVMLPVRVGKPNTELRSRVPRIAAQ